MSSFVPRDTHLDAYLNDKLIGSRPEGFTANDVWPVILTDRLTGNIISVQRDNYLRNPNITKAYGEAAKGFSLTVTSGGVTYNATPFGAAHNLAHEFIDGSELPDALVRAGELVNGIIALNIEKRLVSKLS